MVPAAEQYNNPGTVDNPQMSNGLIMEYKNWDWRGPAKMHNIAHIYNFANPPVNGITSNGWSRKYLSSSDHPGYQYSSEELASAALQQANIPNRYKLQSLLFSMPADIGEITTNGGETYEIAAVEEHLTNNGTWMGFGVSMVPQMYLGNIFPDPLAPFQHAKPQLRGGRIIGYVVNAVTPFTTNTFPSGNVTDPPVAAMLANIMISVGVGKPLKGDINSHTVNPINMPASLLGSRYGIQENAYNWTFTGGFVTPTVVLNYNGLGSINTDTFVNCEFPFTLTAREEFFEPGQDGYDEKHHSQILKFEKNDIIVVVQSGGQALEPAINTRPGSLEDLAYQEYEYWQDGGAFNVTVIVEYNDDDADQDAADDADQDAADDNDE